MLLAVAPDGVINGGERENDMADATGTERTICNDPKGSFRISRYVVAVSVALVLVPTPRAIAQTRAEEQASTATETSAPEQPDGKHRVLAEIVVTAQKTEQSLLDVPLTLQVLDGDELRELATENLEVLTDNLPAVMVSKSGNSQRISVRGIGSGTNEGFEQSVGMFIDGIYLAQGRHLRPKLFDLERVELLKGPQSTLFGTNVTAGAFIYTTTNPTETFKGYFGLLAGQQGEAEGQLTLSGPLSDKVMGRVALYKRSFGGYMNNLDSESRVTDDDDWGARFVILAEPSDRFSIRAAYEHQDLTMLGSVGQITYDPGSSEILAPIIGDDGVFDFNQRGGFQSEFRAIRNGQIDDDNVFDTASINLTFAGRGFTFTSITGYTRFDWQNIMDVDYSSHDLASQYVDMQFDQISQELQVDSAIGERFEYTAGAYFHHQNLDRARASEVRLSSLPISVVVDAPASQDTDVWAVFGQGMYRFNDKTGLTLGLRYTVNDKSVTDVLTIDPPLDSFFGARPHDLQETRSEDHLSWIIRPEFQISDGILLYASASRGYKAGGFDLGIGFGSSAGSQPAPNYEFDPEQATNLEVGTKMILDRGAAMLNLAAYRTDYRDLQVTQFTGFEFSVGNAAEAKIQGIEIDYAHTLTDYLTLGITASFLDFEFESYNNAPCTLRQQAGLDPGCMSSATSEDQVQDLTGGVGEFAPEFSADLNLDAVVPIKPKLIFKGTLNVTYSDEYFTQIGMDPNTLQDAYAKVNLRVALLVGARSAWEIAVVGRNLTNEKVSVNSFNSLWSGAAVPGEILPTYVKFIQRPRSVALQASFWF